MLKKVYKRIFAVIIMFSLLSVYFSRESSVTAENTHSSILIIQILGMITSCNSDTDDITVQLYKEENNELCAETVVKGNNTYYEFLDVKEGNYIVRFSKNNHVSREYFINLNDIGFDAYEGSSVFVYKNAEIYLIGDINGDKKANNKDWEKMYNHIKGTNTLTDYELLCADVNKDGKFDNKDWNKLYNHINETDKLW